jgi:hypothetical protein
LLENDACSVYEFRPKACRLAASGDASICARSYNNLSDEQIPTPALHMMGRIVFSTAVAVALKKCGLPHDAYELVAGLVRALDVPNAEQEWLRGNDIFAGVMRDPDDVMAQPQARMMLGHAFAQASPA